MNLRPLVPGHVLIIPKRVVERNQDLRQNESLDLWRSVREVQQIMQRAHQGDGFNVAIQDGKAAGQTVPHIHVHVLPAAGTQ